MPGGPIIGRPPSDTQAAEEQIAMRTDSFPSGLPADRGMKWRHADRTDYGEREAGRVEAIVILLLQSVGIGGICTGRRRTAHSQQLDLERRTCPLTTGTSSVLSSLSVRCHQQVDDANGAFPARN
uniref:Uncharacterized protein n=1 Tax=Anopheles atroparvus TaxID=41427 RepID=A0AAG5DXM1_ANOAO